MSNILEGTPDGGSDGEVEESETGASSPISVFTTYQSLIDAVNTHEIDTITKYNMKNSPHHPHNFHQDENILAVYLEAVDSDKDIKLHWHQQQKKDSVPIPFNGVPFILLNKRHYSCHQGKNKDVNVKEKRILKRREEAFKSIPAEH